MIAFLFALWYVLFRKPKPVTTTRFYGGDWYSPQPGGNGGVGASSVRPLREAPRRDDDYRHAGFYDGGYAPIDTGSASSGDTGSSSGGGDGGGGGGD